MSGKYEKRSEAMRKRWADPVYRASQTEKIRLMSQDTARNDAISEMRKNEWANNEALRKKRLPELKRLRNKQAQRCKARNYRRKWSWGPTKKSLAMKKLWATKREQMLAAINKSWDTRRRSTHSVVMTNQPRNENSPRTPFWVKREPVKQRKAAPPAVLDIFDQLCERLGCNATASTGFEPKQIHRNDSSAPVIATLGAALCASTPIKLEKTSGDYGKAKGTKWNGGVFTVRKPSKGHVWRKESERGYAEFKERQLKERQ